MTEYDIYMTAMYTKLKLILVYAGLKLLSIHKTIIQIFNSIQFCDISRFILSLIV